MKFFRKSPLRVDRDDISEKEGGERPPALERFEPHPFPRLSNGF
jgi:hypothetical protein